MVGFLVKWFRKNPVQCIHLYIGIAVFDKSAINNELILKLRCNIVLKKGRNYYVSLFNKFIRDNFLAPF